MVLRSRIWMLLSLVVFAGGDSLSPPDDAHPAEIATPNATVAGATLAGAISPLPPPRTTDDSSEPDLSGDPRLELSEQQIIAMQNCQARQRADDAQQLPAPTRAPYAQQAILTHRGGEVASALIGHFAVAADGTRSEISAFWAPQGRNLTPGEQLTVRDLLQRGDSIGHPEESCSAGKWDSLYEQHVFEILDVADADDQYLLDGPFSDETGARLARAIVEQSEDIAFYVGLRDARRREARLSPSRSACHLMARDGFKERARNVRDAAHIECAKYLVRSRDEELRARVFAKRCFFKCGRSRDPGPPCKVESTDGRKVGMRKAPDYWSFWIPLRHMTVDISPDGELYR